MSLGHGYRKQTTLNTGKGKEKPSSHSPKGQLKLLHAMHMSIDLFKWGFKSFLCRFQFAGLKHKIIQDGGDFCWCCLSSCCLWIDVDNEELHIVAAYDKIAISGVGSCNFSPPFNFYCYGKYSKIQDFSQLNWTAEFALRFQSLLWLRPTCASAIVQPPNIYCLFYGVLPYSCWAF